MLLRMFEQNILNEIPSDPEVKFESKIQLFQFFFILNFPLLVEFISKINNFWNLFNFESWPLFYYSDRFRLSLLFRIFDQSLLKFLLSSFSSEIPSFDYRFDLFKHDW